MLAGHPKFCMKHHSTDVPRVILVVLFLAAAIHIDMPIIDVTSLLLAARRCLQECGHGRGKDVTVRTQNGSRPEAAL